MNREAFRRKKWGIFCHYLNNLQNGEGPHNTRSRVTAWDQCVEDLDCEKLASQVSDLGAGYFFITMQQGTRHFIAPSESFQALTGLKDGCAKRDLVLDLHNALSRRGIDLFLYYTGDGMPRDRDPAVVRRFGWTGGVISPDLVREWSLPLREYSLRNSGERASRARIYCFLRAERDFSS